MVETSAFNKQHEKAVGSFCPLYHNQKPEYKDLTENDKKAEAREKCGLCRNLPENQVEQGFKSFRREKTEQGRLKSVQILLSPFLDSAAKPVLLLKQQRLPAERRKK